MKTIKVLPLMGFVIISLMLSSAAAYASTGVCTDAMYTTSHQWVSKGYEITLENARQAVKKTLEENKISIVGTNDQIAGGLAEIEGETQEGTLWVKLTSITDNFTKVSVRYGLNGDDAAAKNIQCEIDAKL